MKLSGTLLLCALFAGPAHADFTATGTLVVKRPFSIVRNISDARKIYAHEQDQLDLTPGAKPFRVYESTYYGHGLCLPLGGCITPNERVNYLEFDLLNPRKSKDGPGTTVSVRTDATSQALRGGIVLYSAADSRQSFSILKKSSVTRFTTPRRTEERGCSVYRQCAPYEGFRIGGLLMTSCYESGTQTVTFHEKVEVTHAQLKFLDEQRAELATFTGSSENRQEVIDEDSGCR